MKEVDPTLKSDAAEGYLIVRNSYYIRLIIICFINCAKWKLQSK